MKSPFNYDKYGGVYLLLSDEQVYVGQARALPLLWLLKEGETRNDVKKKIRQRYWKEEYTSGTRRFLMFSQWFKDGTNYGAHKDDFIRWYGNL